MIWLLRNISVHLWVTTLTAIPVCFYLLPGLTHYFPGTNPMIAAIIILLLIAVVLSLVMDLVIRKMVAGLIKEGQTWERSGIPNKARKKYIRALRLYDTFLLWPFSARKTALKLAGTMAKFSLNAMAGSSPGDEYGDLKRSKSAQNFKLTALVYLRMNPEDQDIAQMWLSTLRQSEIITAFDQEILSLLAEQYSEHSRLSPLILDVLLELERKDYTAKRFYQAILNNPVLQEAYQSKIEALIGQQAPPTLADRKPMAPLEKTVEPTPVKQTSVQTQKIFETLFYNIKRFLLGVWGMVVSIFRHSASFSVQSYQFVKDSQKVRFYAKTGFVIFVSIILVFYVVTTVSHMFKSRVVENNTVEIPVALPKPFTIQVAAYLKEAHALRYVEILKKQKIDARIKQVTGGGKTWYVVRVSEFTDKESAAKYGKELKGRKVIDDFFVSNK